MHLGANIVGEHSDQYSGPEIFIIYFVTVITEMVGNDRISFRQNSFWPFLNLHKMK